VRNLGVVIEATGQPQVCVRLKVARRDRNGKQLRPNVEAGLLGACLSYRAAKMPEVDCIMTESYADFRTSQGCCTQGSGEALHLKRCRFTPSTWQNTRTRGISGADTL